MSATPETVFDDTSESPYDWSPEHLSGELIKHALSMSNLKEAEVDYISAHGTGTHENDKIECLAIKKIFGKRFSSVKLFNAVPPDAAGFVTAST